MDVGLRPTELGAVPGSDRGDGRAFNGGLAFGCDFSPSRPLRSSPVYLLRHKETRTIR